jgi:uncharacterized protein
MAEKEKKRLSVHLIAGGMAHDFDHARMELLKLLAEDDRIRTKVSSTWEEFDDAPDSLLITYCCNMEPSEEASQKLRNFVENGGKWLALHATNSIFKWTDAGVECAPAKGHFLGMLGSAFLAHPPIGDYTVENAGSNHPIVADIKPFTVNDELYLSDFSAPVEVLLSTRFGGEAPGFIKGKWEEDDHPVLYIRKLGKGEILYCTMGHARGHYDAQHRIQFSPEVERGAWDTPEFYEILRRSIKWGMSPQLQKEAV